MASASPAMDCASPTTSRIESKGEEPTTESLVRIETYPRIGRGLCATQAVPSGTVLFSELPVVVSPLKPTLACATCLRSLYSPLLLKCTKCIKPDEFYCGYECRDLALMTHHPALCGRSLNMFRQFVKKQLHKESGYKSGPITDSKSAFGFTTLQASHMCVARIALLLLSKERRIGATTTGSVPTHHDRMLDVYESLTSDMKQSRPPLYYKPFVIVLRACLISSDADLPKSFAMDEDWYRTEFQRIELNSFMVTGPIPPPLSGIRSAKKSVKKSRKKKATADDIDYMAAYGKSCYARQSLINHSCEPNAVVRGDDCVTLRAIEAGEQVLIKYDPDGFDTDDAKDKDVNHRLLALAEKFGFACSCVRCVKEVANVRQQTWTDVKERLRRTNVD